MRCQGLKQVVGLLSDVQIEQGVFGSDQSADFSFQLLLFIILTKMNPGRWTFLDNFRSTRMNNKFKHIIENAAQILRN
jgi:hypothetical protein